MNKNEMEWTPTNLLVYKTDYKKDSFNKKNESAGF
jgi:hypothetical protein